MLFIVDGEGEIRLGDARHVIRAGESLDDWQGE
jgi:uncharacterized cupin superfamily protein